MGAQLRVSLKPLGPSQTIVSRVLRGELLGLHYVERRHSLRKRTYFFPVGSFGNKNLPQVMLEFFFISICKRLTPIAMLHLFSKYFEEDSRTNLIRTPVET